MTQWIGTATVIASSATVGFGVLVARVLGRYLTSAVVLPDEEIPVDRYAAMRRLSSSEDFTFLQTLPGYTQEMGTRFQRDRRKVFRMYLREVVADFRRVHAAARQMVSRAPEEHADLVAILFQQQVTFYRSIAMIELRLGMTWAGVPQVDLGSLVGSLESLRRAAQLAPVPA